ncbi:unnamed protein product [Didymodactylos carnosus]|nr:unnamed protein product [Didymodactylos carnosus]CAF3535050.1 unnamed protein product [Didymodactylos carnosus]
MAISSIHPPPPPLMSFVNGSMRHPLNRHPPPQLMTAPNNNFNQNNSNPKQNNRSRNHRNHNRRGRTNRPYRHLAAPAPNAYHPYPRPQHPYRQRYQQSQQQSQTPQQARTPLIMSTPPGMSQAEYELLHLEQVKRDKEKLLRCGNVLAPSNTTQFIIQDHNRKTPTLNNGTGNQTLVTHQEGQQQTSGPSVPHSSFEQLFDDVDDDCISTTSGEGESSDMEEGKLNYEDDFNDIYYQCRYERYNTFSRSALLKEVMSLCMNVDRLQYEKSELEKRLKDLQQQQFYMYQLPQQVKNGQQPTMQPVVPAAVTTNEDNTIHTEAETTTQISIDPSREMIQQEAIITSP